MMATHKIALQVQIVTSHHFFFFRFFQCQEEKKENLLKVQQSKFTVANAHNDGLPYTSS